MCLGYSDWLSSLIWHVVTTLYSYRDLGNNRHYALKFLIIIIFSYVWHIWIYGLTLVNNNKQRRKICLWVSSGSHILYEYWAIIIYTIWPHELTTRACGTHDTHCVVNKTRLSLLAYLFCVYFDFEVAIMSMSLVKLVLVGLYYSW